MDKRIQSLFNHLIQLQSDTGTVQEIAIAKEIHHHLATLPYFKEYPEHLILQEIPTDPFGRFNVVGLMKGRSDKTTIMIHHHDAVDIEVYEELKDMALSPALLKEALKSKSLPEEIAKDLEDPHWLFGRGAADMKAGAAIQLTLMEEFSTDPTFEDNLVILSVCDEENLSAGMRAASAILKELQHTYKLDYKVIINSEPVGRINETTGIYYEGTVGKIMPVLFAKGKKAHIGEVYSGFNPLMLLSEIQGQIELNPALTDVYKGEVSPSPTWVHYRDRKSMYDASLPESAAAYFSILTLEKTPKRIIEEIRSLSKKAFKQAIQRYEACVDAVNHHSATPIHKLNFEPLVMTIDELHSDLLHLRGSTYTDAMESETKQLKVLLDSGVVNLQNASIQLIEKAVSFVDHDEPFIVIGYSGPYYPHLTNEKLGLSHTTHFETQLNTITKKHFGRSYKKFHYFMGISDFSYTSLKISQEDIDTIEKNMLGWKTFYDIPFENLSTLNIPMMNIGPWGKDLHKLTERVHIEDAFVNVPLIIKEFIKAL